MIVYIVPVFDPAAVLWVSTKVPPQSMNFFMSSSEWKQIFIGAYQIDWPLLFE